MWMRVCVIYFFLLLVCGTSSRGDVRSDLSPEQIEFFESRIRPVLAERCYKCHSSQSEKIKGGLLLDTREGLLKGGDNGPAIVPGNAERSRLIEAVRQTNEDLKMPPRDK